jgi:CRP-like cAMP-binding protein
MSVRNLLLAALPSDVMERLTRHMRTVDLKYGAILHRPGQRIKDVYFPLDCLISVTVTMAEARTAEAGIVGSREMVGVNAFMGGRETNQTEYICQASGAAVRMLAEPLLKEFDEVKKVRDVMLRYTQAYIAQLSQNVACNRLHTVAQRLARWMMECRDRLGTDDLSLSHEFIGQMLGARRAGVTEAAAKFQKRGLIKYGRMKLRILDAQRLADASCECFGVIREEYDRLLGIGPALLA